MLDKIKISGIVEESIVDGPGIRLVVFTQGCLRGCEECHNQSTWNLNGGYFEDINKIASMWKNNPLISGLTISGGEPFIQVKECLELAKKAKESSLNVLIYTGYYLEELKSSNKEDINELLNLIDYLIDGPFEIQKRDLNLTFMGSTNQRFIEMKKEHFK